MHLPTGGDAEEPIGGVGMVGEDLPDATLRVGPPLARPLLAPAVPWRKLVVFMLNHGRDAAVEADKSHAD
ncbi:MAG: hypothetical protein H6Q99_3140, partial [Proteobacteria bacterium]|nr:hypothetical protein [Pseudomonadota bacterium]